MSLSEKAILLAGWGIGNFGSEKRPHACSRRRRFEDHSNDPH
jgi:hypothetical protein